MAKKSKEQVQDFSIPVNSPTDYYFAGVPYKLPDDEELDYRTNFRELTDDIKNGAGWLYRNSLKGSPYDNPLFDDKWTSYKFFTAPDGRVWYAANDNWNGELPAGYKEIAYKDVRRMLPKRDYFGGATAEEVRLRAVRQIPGLWEKVPVRAATFLYEAGMPWMIAFLYLLLIFVVADIGVLCRILPKSFLNGSAAGLCSVVGLTAIIMLSGSIHYRHKYREELTIRTDKPLDHPLTIVLASDLHLGYHNRRTELARWVDPFNAEHPDIILFGGDLVDRSLRPVLAGDYAAEMKRIEATMFTVLGNHEYYSDRDGAARFFQDAGITLLRDENADVGSIRIIGRDDRTNTGRKALAELVADTSIFTILLDHQPYHLEEAEAAGIDFQFSGHTHRGQVWPASWITDAIYEKSWGYHQRGGTRYYISSGLGIWGPKIRIGSRSEYVVLHLCSLL